MDLHVTRRDVAPDARAWYAHRIWKLAFPLILAMAVAGCATVPPSYEERDQPVSVADVEILDKADQLLASESDWNRKDTRECPPDAKTLSLFCALQKASIEVLGSYDHRRVALQEVRFAIEDVSGGREFEHRLMDFNNLPETKFGDVKKVIAIARGRVVERLENDAH
ncbi:DUF6197 family protein [Lysobacter niastensis]|uniref:Uncharacterized protein n=1 Tax=Lysobacter niastensis TaxID=380629 RepID=A0ABS0B9M8_9GAMM|nr:hypothetical protein [Lysobacter niastensis]MBF6023714.1 hypothetical protein [Lysobacter niastensis]